MHSWIPLLSLQYLLSRRWAALTLSNFQSAQQRVPPFLHSKEQARHVIVFTLHCFALHCTALHYITLQDWTLLRKQQQKLSKISRILLVYWCKCYKLIGWAIAHYQPLVCSGWSSSTKWWHFLVLLMVWRKLLMKMGN